MLRKRLGPEVRLSRDQSSPFLDNYKMLFTLHRCLPAPRAGSQEFCLESDRHTYGLSKRQSLVFAIDIYSRDGNLFSSRGIPDMIDPDSGILVPPGDAHALTKAMIHLAKNPQLRLRMGQAALERYRTLFSPNAVVPLMLETYARVAASAKQPESRETNKSCHPWSRCR